MEEIELERMSRDRGEDDPRVHGDRLHARELENGLLLQEVRFRLLRARGRGGEQGEQGQREDVSAHGFLEDPAIRPRV
jgi:hypothetical protein